jgi:AGCS family alanine or glycine:cation symporter
VTIMALDLELIVEQVRGFVWGIPLLALLLGTGLYLTFLLRGIQFSQLLYALQQVIVQQKKGSRGDISQFEALMTTLAGAIGTGSIVGVATAVSVGGLGALVWMWVTAFVGMATKYAEGLLAIKYRVVDEKGEMVGGPMAYIERGLGWRWLAMLFALFGIGASLGTGNLVQVNSIAAAVSHLVPINPWWIGGALALLTATITLGGVKSIGRVAAILVPAMALLYFFGGLLIIAMNYQLVPAALTQILSSAFTGQAALGGFAGSTLMMAVQLGIARGAFTTEAGLGISSIACAAARTDSPVRFALINMTGALLVVITCTVTGLVIAVTGVLGAYDADGNVLAGAAMAITAFSKTLAFGHYVVIVGLILFAYTTTLAWAYYGEKCAEYLFGVRAVIPFRIIYMLLVIPGAAIPLRLAWGIADVMNGLLAIPNLIAIIALSHVLVKETQLFFTRCERPLESSLQAK